MTGHDNQQDAAEQQTKAREQQRSARPRESRPSVVLCILDGVGFRSGPGSEIGNATVLSEPAFYSSLLERYPYTTLDACGLSVGLPEGQMGNSEVGHLTIGAGRIVNQELVRISNHIDDGRFREVRAFRDLCQKTVAGSGRLHLLGLVSPGGVHSHTDHLYGIVQAARDAGVAEIYIHAFLDGRDTDPRSGRGYVATLQEKLDEIDAGRIASVSGRYYAMDRDKRWERVVKAWDMLVHGRGETGSDAVTVIERSYAADVTDEFVLPTVLTDDDGRPVATVRDGDSIFFWNFRADRARELTWAFKQPDFDGFDVGDRPEVDYLTMTPYDEKLADLPVMFTPVRPANNLAEVFAEHGITNLRTAETEKYAHVTYFFNGGREEPYPHEDRRLIPSPQVATYDLQPEMSAPEVAQTVRQACADNEFDVIVVNFANGDMVGHTGVLDAAITAFKTLDGLLAEIVPPSVEAGAVWLITADHGNCDEMIDAEGRPLTAHSLNHVPFIVVGRQYAGAGNTITAGPHGLADIAPTVLGLLGIAQPPEMTGRSIIAID